MADAVFEVVKQAARTTCGPSDFERLAAAVSRVDSWDALPELAEMHGVAPLLNAHLTSGHIAIPGAMQRHLFALATRHRCANEARFLALAEILHALDLKDIPVLVLKGAALAHVVYPHVALRPMSDIDLLVDSKAASSAQAVLASLGYDAPESADRRALVGHHHLPAATKIANGYVIRVEVHRDAFSRDSKRSLTINRLSTPPERFIVGGQTASTLGPLDMLHHLYEHMAGRSERFRLIWLADFVGYAIRYRDRIPWDELRARYPFVINAFSLLHAVLPLPSELRQHLPAVDDGGAAPLRGIGQSCKPLKDILVWDRRLADIGRDLFDPSDWWLRLHYGVDANRSLWWTRSVTHPVRIGRWLARRGVTMVRWRVDGTMRRDDD